MSPLAELQEWAQGLTQAVAETRRWQAVGRVVELVGLTVIAEGPPAAVGELCLISLPGGPDGKQELPAQVVGFRRGLTLLLPLTRLAGVEPGCLVRAVGTPLTTPVGESLLGRVVDAFGSPIDGRGSLGRCQRRPIESAPPPALQRRRVLEPMYFGIRALDALLTCGKGQRIGIFSGAGVGKSSLLGMMARHTDADVIVVALVGERGREVRDFVEARLNEALPRSVVVAATSDEPALVRITAGLTATTIAEYFRDQGLSVLLIVDSLTRLARAQREAGLAAGETPTTRGFPPSVYEFLPRLLERAGCGATGAITGVYSVLVEGDDMQEPVADAVSAILDGHIVLSRELADQGHHPAIAVTASVSRLMPQVVDREHLQAAQRVRALLAARQEVEDLIAVGAYRPGSHRMADQALRQWDQLSGFLRQEHHEKADLEATRRALLQLGAPATGLSWTVRSRQRHVAALLQRALRQRKLLDGEVRGLAAELQALRRRLQEAQREAETPAAVTTMSAAALMNRQRYEALSEARIARLVEDVGQAERRLRERRVALQQAAQQALVWEKLAARLEQRRVDLERRLQQEIIDQHSQARQRDRSI